MNWKMEEYSQSPTKSQRMPQLELPDQLFHHHYVVQSVSVIVVKQLDRYCSPQFWDVDKRCGAGDDSPRRWVWQEVERIRSCSAHLPICYPTVAFLGGSEKGSEGKKCDPPPCGGNCCNPCCRAFGRSCTNRSGWRSPWSIARNQLEPCDKFAM